MRGFEGEVKSVAARVGVDFDKRRSLKRSSWEIGVRINNQLTLQTKLAELTSPCAQFILHPLPLRAHPPPPPLPSPHYIVTSLYLLICSDVESVTDCNSNKQRNIPGTLLGAMRLGFPTICIVILTHPGSRGENTIRFKVISFSLGKKCIIYLYF